MLSSAARSGSDVSHKAVWGQTLTACVFPNANFPKWLSIENREHSVFPVSFRPLKIQGLPIRLLRRLRMVFKAVFTSETIR